MWELLLVLLLIAIIVVPLFVCLYTLANPWLDERRLQANRQGTYDVEQRMTYIPATTGDDGFQEVSREKYIERVNKVEKDKALRYPRLGAFAFSRKEHLNDANSNNDLSTIDDTRNYEKNEESVFNFSSELTSQFNEENIRFADEGGNYE